MNSDRYAGSFSGDELGDQGRAPAVRVSQSPDEPLMLDPHYTDDRFRRERTVFGSYRKNLTDYVYSDRLWQWDYDKAGAAFAAANREAAAGQVTAKSARWLEVMLSHYLGRKVSVLHVIAGVNCSSGYAYYVIGYKNG